MKKRLFFLIVIATLMLATLPINVTAQDETPWPTEGWVTSTPEEQGIDSEQLIAILDHIEQAQLPLHSLLIVRNGYLVLDAYFYPFRQGMKHDLYSVVKSFNAALVGIAIEEGYLEGVDQRLLDVFSDRNIANVDAQKESITLEHVLMMSGGLGCADETGSDLANIGPMVASDDWAQYVLDLPMTYAPGTSFTYCDGFAQILAAAIQEQTGMSPLEYGQDRLFGPLGIEDIEWVTDPQGVNLGGDGLSLQPHDMAKFGLLYLNQGMWDGAQIVPAQWVAASSCADPNACPFYDMMGTFGYGYQWWTESSGGYYMAIGYGGQFIIVAPELDMVVVATTYGGDNDVVIGSVLFGLMNGMIMPATASDGPLPENPDAVERLNARIAALTNPSEPVEVAALPAVAETISGQAYDLAEMFDFNLGPFPSLTTFTLGGHTGDVKAIAVAFEQADEALLTLTFADDYQLALPVGLDGGWRVTDSRFGPLALKGHWRSDDTFRFDLSHVSNALMLSVDLNFEATPIQVISHERSSHAVDIVIGWPHMDQ